MPTATLHLFGNARLTRDGRELSFRSRRALAILARVILARGAIVSRRSLVDSLWPELDSERGFAALRRELHRIDSVWREVETRPLIDRDGRSLTASRPLPLDVDVLAFDTAYDTGDYEGAVSRYAGPLCGDFTDPDLVRERSRLSLRANDAFDRLIATSRQAGRLDVAIAFAMQAQAVDPYREQTVRTLMQLRAEIGDRAGVVTTYQAFETLLAADMAAKPLPATTAVFVELERANRNKASVRMLPIEHDSFVGRDADIAKIRELLRERRTVTITGAPGVGKSRIALRIAHDVSGEYDDGVFFVDLSKASRPTDIVRSFAESIGERLAATADSLESAIERRSTLIVVDNCEHLVDDAAKIVARLHAASPRSSILATSRRPLRFRAESEWRLDPLPIAPAVRLFLDRARAMRPSAIASDVSSTVENVCRRLDGLPLAIEIAAARLRMMTINELERSLMARQPGIADATGSSAPISRNDPYGWSYGLLDDDARIAFRRLGIFVGDFDLEAAKALCADLGPARAFAAIGELIDHSMIVAVDGAEGESRFKLLFSAREFALARLLEHAEMERVRALYVNAFVPWIVGRSSGLAGPQRATIFHELQRDFANIIAVIDILIVDRLDCETGLRVTTALSSFWTDASANAEGLRYIRLAFDAIPHDSSVRGKALLLASTLARLTGDAEAAKTYARTAATLLTDPAQTAERLAAFVLLAHAQTVTCHHAEALVAGRQAFELATRLGTDSAKISPLMVMGQVSLSVGDIDGAKAAYGSAVTLASSVGAVREGIIALNNLAMCAYCIEDDDDARRYALAALERGRELAFAENVAWALSILAGVAWRRDDVATALRYGEDLDLAARMTKNRILHIRFVEECAAALVRLRRGRNRCGTPCRCRCGASEIRAAAATDRRAAACVVAAYHRRAIRTTGQGPQRITSARC